MIPDLIKLEKKAKNIALALLQKEKGLESYQAIDADIKVWRQLWSDTSCGTSKTENYISGCAMTYGYMTVVDVSVYCGMRYDVYVVFYDGREDCGFAQLKEKLNKEFFTDLKKFQIKPFYLAKKFY